MILKYSLCVNVMQQTDDNEMTDKQMIKII